MTSGNIPAARFIRVSGDSQDEKSQIADCDRAAGRDGLTFTVPDYQLHAVSGSKGDKRHLAALESALAAIRSGEIRAVVVAHSSRLTRQDPDEALLYAIQVRQAGGRVHSWDEPHFGAPDKLGRLLSVLAIDDNHEYSRTLSGHVSRKFRWMDDQGSFRGCPPAGYRVEGEKYAKRLVPDSGRADLVRTAFADATSGTGTVELGRRLGMTPEAIGKILRNPVYSTGRYLVHRADGVTVAHRCEPLVHPDVQAAAVLALEARRTGDNVTTRAIAKADYSGAVYCPNCDKPLYRYFGGGKKYARAGRRPLADLTRVAAAPAPDQPTHSPRTRRYQCAKNRGGCGKSVMADAADAAVEALMSSRSEWWLDRWLVPGDDHAAELDRVRLEYRELSARGLSFEDEDAERDRLRAEIRRLESLPSVPARWEQGFKTNEAGELLTEAHRWAGLDSAGRRQWLTGEDIRVYATAAPGRTGAVEIELVHTDDD